MLRLDRQNIQHESTAVTRGMYSIPIHSNFNLNVYRNILKNDIEEIDGKKYSAWWFCCIPVEIAKLDNLPLGEFRALTQEELDALKG